MTTHKNNAAIKRPDYGVICGLVEPGAKVLDLGCGAGDLLRLLVGKKGVKGQGIELDEQSIYKCVEKGLSVFHSDIDTGLPEYPDAFFDYVILNQSLQQAKKVEYVLEEAMRVGRQVIVGFPNFAHIDARVQLFFKGAAPVTANLPYRWYNSPNIHFLSIHDFEDFCSRKNIDVRKRYYIGDKGPVGFLPNVFARNAIFVIAKR